MKLRWEAGVENVPTFLCILQLSDTLLSTDLAREKIYSLPSALSFRILSVPWEWRLSLWLKYLFIFVPSDSRYVKLKVKCAELKLEQ